MAASDAIDDDTRGLIVQLLTRAGVIMEDASADAVLSAGGGVLLADVIARVENASREIAALAAAAKTLLDETD